MKITVTEKGHAFLKGINEEFNKSLAASVEHTPRVDVTLPNIPKKYTFKENYFSNSGIYSPQNATSHKHPLLFKSNSKQVINIHNDAMLSYLKAKYDKLQKMKNAEEDRSLALKEKIKSKVNYKITKILTNGTWQSPNLDFHKTNYKNRQSQRIVQIHNNKYMQNASPLHEYLAIPKRVKEKYYSIKFSNQNYSVSRKSVDAS